MPANHRSAVRTSKFDTNVNEELHYPQAVHLDTHVPHLWGASEVSVSAEYRRLAKQVYGTDFKGSIRVPKEPWERNIQPEEPPASTAKAYDCWEEQGSKSLVALTSAEQRQQLEPEKGRQEQPLQGMACKVEIKNVAVVREEAGVIALENEVVEEKQEQVDMALKKEEGGIAIQKEKARLTTRKEAESATMVQAKLTAQESERRKERENAVEDEKLASLHAKQRHEQEQEHQQEIERKEMAKSIAAQQEQEREKMEIAVKRDADMLAIQQARAKVERENAVEDEKLASLHAKQRHEQEQEHQQEIERKEMAKSIAAQQEQEREKMEIAAKRDADMLAIQQARAKVAERRRMRMSGECTGTVSTSVDGSGAFKGFASHLRPQVIQGVTIFMIQVII